MAISDYDELDDESENALVVSRRELAKWTRATAITAACNTHIQASTSPSRSIITDPKDATLRSPPTVRVKAHDESDQHGGDDGACSVGVVERGDSDQTIAEDG
ncbi:hypothetical protein HDU90_008898 [Geranomyces variabilis]|nr:hypothetical protein HDU90_008898 [Geranomyces variabilis]